MDVDRKLQLALVLCAYGSLLAVLAELRWLAIGLSVAVSTIALLRLARSGWR